MENIKKYTYYISDLHFTIGTKNYIISDSVGDSFICRITNNSDTSDECFSHIVVHKSDIKRFLEIENGKELSNYEIIKIEEFFGKGFFGNCHENYKVYSNSVKRNFNVKSNQPDYVFFIKGKYRVAIWDGDKSIGYQITCTSSINKLYTKGWAYKIKEMNVVAVIEDYKYDMLLSLHNDNLLYKVTEIPVKHSENIEDTHNIIGTL
jgi:hypothetical protein